MMGAFHKRLWSDDGFTISEVMVASLIGAILALSIGVFLVDSMRAGAFTDGESATINDARNAMGLIEKEIRGAGSVTFPTPCTPAGGCLEVLANTPTGGTQDVLYTFSGPALNRQQLDPSTHLWTSPKVVVDRLQNGSTQPVFSCDAQTTLLRITVDLHIAPTPDSNPTYDVSTTIKPRNLSRVPGVSGC